MTGLSRDRVESLCSFVDERVQQHGCDHSHRFSREWAAKKSVDWDDLLDVLEAHGGHCDCEVVLNLPDDADLSVKAAVAEPSSENPWRLPPAFTAAAGDMFSKMIVCDAKVGRNTHAADRETLVPAPKGAKARKRVRSSVHFFVGCPSGMPTEVGVVAECPPISAEAFARAVAGSGVEELKGFTYREAAFVLSKVAGLTPGTTVGTSFLDVCDIAEKWEELRVHKVFMRR